MNVRNLFHRVPVLVRIKEKIAYGLGKAIVRHCYSRRSRRIREAEISIRISILRAICLKDGSR